MSMLVRVPTVSILAAPVFTPPEHLPVRWRGEGTDAERLSEFAGRLCYMSQHNPANRTTAQYLHNILRQGHGSILEHATVVVLVEGISRAATHELIRHRAGFGYSQLSQRFVGDHDLRFVVPPAVLEHEEVLLPPFTAAMEAAHRAYRELVEHLEAAYDWIDDPGHRRKVAREAARATLPNAVETKIVISANIRAWRTMLEQRLGEGAEREVRRLGIELLAALRSVAPALFADFTSYIAPDGAPAVRVEHRKV